MCTIQIERSSASTLERVRAVYTLYWDALNARNGDLLVQVYLQHFPLRSRSLTDLDIDDKSIQFAKLNVQANGLQSRIMLLQTKPDDPLLPLEKMKVEK